MREEIEVITVRVDQICDECKEGRMRPTGMCLTSASPQYPHRCTHCDKYQNFHATYPRIEHKVKE